MLNVFIGKVVVHEADKSTGILMIMMMLWKNLIFVGLKKNMEIDMAQKWDYAEKIPNCTVSIELPDLLLLLEYKSRYL